MKRSLRPYSLLLLGHQTLKKTLSLDDAIDCWQQVTVALHESLKRLNHVQCVFHDNHAAECSEFYDELPNVDAVLFWGVPQIWMSYDHGRLRRSTGCRAIVTVCERAIRQSSNWRFAFTGRDRKTTHVHAPVFKEAYSQIEKVSQAILLDHWDQDTPSDWTFQIEEWICDSLPEFDVTRYVQSAADRRILEGDHRSSEMWQLPRLPYRRWLAETDHLETFVMTHRESYGYAVLDMFARGTRVACPRPFVPPHFHRRFHFDTFETKQELLEILREPPDPDTLKRNRVNLTDWSEVVQLVDERLQALLRK